MKLTFLPDNDFENGIREINNIINEELKYDIDPEEGEYIPYSILMNGIKTFNKYIDECMINESFDFLPDLENHYQFHVLLENGEVSPEAKNRTTDFYSKTDAYYTYMTIDEYRDYAYSLISKPAITIDLNYTSADKIANCWSEFLNSDKALRFYSKYMNNGKGREQFLLMYKSEKPTTVIGTAIDICFVDRATMYPNTLYPLSVTDAYRKFPGLFISERI